VGVKLWVLEECLPGEVPEEEVYVIIPGAGLVLFVDVVADQDRHAHALSVLMACWIAGKLI
jgi:hypothetical protein